MGCPVTSLWCVLLPVWGRVWWAEGRVSVCVCGWVFQEWGRWSVSTWCVPDTHGLCVASVSLSGHSGSFSPWAPVRRGAGLLQASVGCGGLQRRRPLVYVCREGLRASAGGLAVLFEPCGQALRSLSVAGSPGKPGKPCLCDEDAFRTNLGARRQQ